MNNKNYSGHYASERSKASNLLTAILSIIFCLFTHSSNAKDQKIENLFTILQNTRNFCKKIFKGSYTLKNLDYQGLYDLQQIGIEGGVVICNLKNQTQNGSCVGLLGQARPQPLYGDPLIDPIIDDQPTFWPYDLAHQIWHKGSLISYLQQPDTQINSDAPATATKKTILPDQNNLLHDQPVVTDALLEELLGVHTRTTHAEQAKSIWAKFSFDCTLGVGAVFYTNRLQHMQLIQRQDNTYFLRSKTNQVYKPNWFHHTLDKVTDFGPFEAYGRNEKIQFQGKGLGLPITLGIQYLCGQRLFIGLGREMIFNATSRLTLDHNHISDKAYRMHQKWSAQGRWFAKCGWYAFDNEKHRFFGDMRLFYVHHLGNKLARLVTFGPYLHQTVAYNFGVGYEQQLTDYLSYTMRFAMELQTFKQFDHKNYNIYYRQPAIYLQVGLSMRCTKCNRQNHLNNKACHTKNHTLNDPSKLDGLQDLLDLD
ncbi:hypothetical protein ACRRVB_03275 [Candidatus Cardinium hertigii]|uniref:hypothetical protein n=1 Tax=Candidatus Cardinium hertigii TaxID=247481 RepID=UPI003D7EF737